MALTPITQKQSLMIANNIAKVIKKQDMSLLSISAYKFISIQAGFIAHYNLQGFKDYYRNDVRQFAQEILDYKNISSRTNYQPDHKNYEYYKSKANTYLLICEKLEEF